MKPTHSYSKWQWIGWPFIVAVIYFAVIWKTFSDIGVTLPPH
jgi:hypothetical protein